MVTNWWSRVGIPSQGGICRRPEDLTGVEILARRHIGRKIQRLSPPTLVKITDSGLYPSPSWRVTRGIGFRESTSIAAA